MPTAIGPDVNSLVIDAISSSNSVFLARNASNSLSAFPSAMKAEPVWYRSFAVSVYRLA